MNIRLKDGSSREVAEACSAFELAQSISEGLARVVCAAEINGELKDLRTPLAEGDEVNLLTFEDEGGRLAFRHSTSHVLAQAVKRLFPETKLAIGPPIEDGFYYDFDHDGGFSEADLERIEAEMKKVIKEGFEITHYTLPREEALAYEQEQNEPYKVELINDLPEEATIGFYKQGEFIDLCAGPHLMNLKPIKAFKLTALAGAYWRGSEKNKMLTRIYGTSFPKKADLDAHLERIEEAKRRDHRKLGKELKLFLFSEEGPGFPFWLPNGMILKNTLLEYWKQVHVEKGYDEISTPIILNRRLWETSGHWSHYKENMYTTVIDDEDYAVKPMNCPGGMLVYKSEPHSYRDLPLRLAELGLVHRHEKSGALHGLMRVRSFTQDDAHIFMTAEQITDEIKNVVRFMDEIYSLFDFRYRVELSTRPEDFMGEIADWDQAEAALKEALDELGIVYHINEGDGAFYGPKIDFKIEDSIGRTWQCGTVQLDFQLPQRFEAEYVGADGEKHRPIMIHRAMLGSIERFIGILTEHCAGKFPVWLAPEQCRILPISADKHGDYAKQLSEKLQAQGIRAQVDGRNEKIGYKIREAQVQKVPYMLIVGDQEVAEGKISVRKRDHQETANMSVEAFAEQMRDLIEKRTWAH